MSKVDFLGYIISENGIGMDQEKIKTFLEWKELTTVKEAQSFLGFANFCHHFIPSVVTIFWPKITREFHILNNAIAQQKVTTTSYAFGQMFSSSMQNF